MCMAEYADSEGWVLLTRQVRKARKPHRCDDCYRQILAREIYTVATFCGDGTVERHNMCNHCAVAADWLKQNCGGFLYGGLLEDIAEHVQEYRAVYPKVARDLKRLQVQAANKWRFRYGPSAGNILPIPKLPSFPAANGGAK